MTMKDTPDRRYIFGRLKEMGVSQKDFCAGHGIKPATLSEYKTGKRELTPDVGVKVAGGFGMTWPELARAAGLVPGEPAPPPMPEGFDAEVIRKRAIVETYVEVLGLDGAIEALREALPSPLPAGSRLPTMPAAAAGSNHTGRRKAR